MPIYDRMTDARYHQHRVEQERALSRRARTQAARDRHAELMRLHEYRRDGLPLPG